MKEDRWETMKDTRGRRWRHRCACVRTIVYRPLICLNDVITLEQSSSCHVKNVSRPRGEGACACARVGAACRECVYIRMGQDIGRARPYNSHEYPCVASQSNLPICGCPKQSCSHYCCSAPRPSSSAASMNISLSQI